jgi:hypothetical protein
MAEEQWEVQEETRGRLQNIVARRQMFEDGTSGIRHIITLRYFRTSGWKVEALENHFGLKLFHKCTTNIFDFKGGHMV